MNAIRNWLLIVLLAPLFCNAAGKPCKALRINIKKGTLNNIPPTVSINIVEQKLPCYTGSSTGNAGLYYCGDGVIFHYDDCYFNTDSDYIEAGSKFRGTTSFPVLGKSPSAISKIFGQPVRQQLHGAAYFYFYKTNYGCLVIESIDNTIIKFDMYAKKTEDVWLCL